MKDPCNVLFYGGALDGLERTFPVNQWTFNMKLKDYPEALYHESKPWSDHFKRRTAVPKDFKGNPPQTELV